jgi:hypothetical protein
MRGPGTNNRRGPVIAGLPFLALAPVETNHPGFRWSGDMKGVAGTDVCSTRTPASRSARKSEYSIRSRIAP